MGRRIRRLFPWVPQVPVLKKITIGADATTLAGNAASPSAVR